MAIKCSARRVLLQTAQTLLSQAIQLNEQALQTATTLAGGTAATKILISAGPTSTANTVTAELVTVLAAIDWAWATE